MTSLKSVIGFLSFVRPPDLWLPSSQLWSSEQAKLAWMVLIFLFVPSVNAPGKRAAAEQLISVVLILCNLGSPTLH